MKMQETKSDINNILNRQNHHSSEDKCVLAQLQQNKTTSNFTGNPTVLAGTPVSDIKNT